MEELTPSTNKTNLKFVLDNYSLGPLVTSIYTDENKVYWSQLAKIWRVPEEQARNRLCANCEYFNNTPRAMEYMGVVPIDKLDEDGGGRGYCVKFEFICHNLRTCSAWEEKEFEEPEDSDDMPPKTGNIKSMLTFKGK